MSKKRILLIDDEQGNVQTWTDAIFANNGVPEQFTIDGIDSSRFEEILKQLENRRTAARKSDGKSFDELDRCELDAVDILIVDYDLLRFDELDDGWAGVTTGERVAYLARCYSRCGLIVALNQFGTNSFDLTLKGHPESFADLNAGSDQISNGGLWTNDPQSGFRPWYWSPLPSALEMFNARVGLLLDDLRRLNQPILQTLGFPQELSTLLPRTVVEFLSRSENPESVTFNDFVLESGSCLSRQDEPINDEAVARIAAARVSKWVERLLCPGQDIVVDAPHLVSRFPSLLKGDKSSEETWNQTAVIGNDESIPIAHELLEKFLFPRPWSSRPVWFWDALKDCEAIEEIKAPFKKTAELPTWVFCEDLSRFLPREGTRRFIADVPSPFVRRYIVDTETEVGAEFKKYVANVDYSPKVRLAM